VVLEKFKLKNLNHEELLRFRVVSTVCTSQAGAHILFDIIGMMLAPGSRELTSSVDLVAMAKQLGGSDLIDKPSPNAAPVAFAPHLVHCASVSLVPKGRSEVRGGPRLYAMPQSLAPLGLAACGAAGML
jgi:hypothetical protein